MPFAIAKFGSSEGQSSQLADVNDQFKAGVYTSPGSSVVLNRDQLNRAADRFALVLGGGREPLTDARRRLGPGRGGQRAWYKRYGS